MMLSRVRVPIESERLRMSIIDPFRISDGFFLRGSAFSFIFVSRMFSNYSRLEVVVKAAAT